MEQIICENQDEFGFHMKHLCFSLKKIYIPPSVNRIREFAFSKCDLLLKIFYSKDVNENQATLKVSHTL